MSKYTLESYQEDTRKLRKGLKNKRPIYYIMKEYFPDYKEDKKKLRSTIQNCLNGNSYQKTIEMKLMPMFKKIYQQKTGIEFNKL